MQRAAGGAGTDDGERVPLSPIRRTIARRMEQAAAIPQVTTFRTVDATSLEAVRAELGVSPLPVFVAALCRTIASHPILNATWADDAIVVHDTVHAGIAVDTERGLFMSVIHDASSKGVAELSAEIRRLAEAARGGSLAPDEATGATISVSNTGSYGSEAGTPLLNPPGAVTIALGVIETARAGHRRRRRRGSSGVHDQPDVRPSRPRRRRRRSRPHRPRRSPRGRRRSPRAVAITLPAMKVVSLLPSATEIVFALGLGDSLVGVTDECDFPPEAVTKPVVSRSALPQGRPAVRA